MDSVIPPDVKVSFFKMDIEGSEWKALKGMQRTLRSCNSFITEFLTPGLRRTGGDPWAYLAQLADSGFTRIFDVDAMRETSAAELKDSVQGAHHARGTAAYPQSLLLARRATRMRTAGRVGIATVSVLRRTGISRPRSSRT